MKKLFLLLPFIAVLCLSSCTSESYLYSFSRFVDKTDAQCQYYSTNRWQRNINQFRNYSIDRFARERGRLSASQIREVLRLDARYLAIVSSQSAVDIKGLVDDVKSAGPEVIGTFLDEFRGRMKDQSR